MKGRELAWRWLQKIVEERFEGLPRRAFLNSLSQSLHREYPQLRGREQLVRERIEELCKEGIQRHSSLAVDSRAQIHLHMACLVQASYKTLLPWLGNDREKVIEMIRKPVGESAAGPLGFAQRFVLFFHLNKFNFVSNSLKLMEADFGKAFSLSHQVSPGIHKVRVSRCLYHSMFTAEDLPELTPVFCALDRLWFDQLRPQKHGVEFLRPSTLAGGNASCEFIVKEAHLKDPKQGT
ncbi:unnamed protein product [Calypogeia fissa]